MSIQCKYITSDKLTPNRVSFVNYQCDDMSITKSSDKTYSENNELHKDHPCFGYIQIYYLKNPLIYVTTPPMKCLFGVTRSGSNNFQMSLQFTDLEEDPVMKQFFDFIQNTEFMCMKHLGLTEEDSDRFISQIKYDKDEIYEPNLSVKLPFHYNKFVTDLYSDFSSAVNIFNIKKFQRMECDIFADKVWRMNDKFYMKWKCKIIHIF
tara:strand:+ start:914 stop:1534 length:621 start_codon:yes stop_codon:yes gene_type:complete